MEIYKKTEHGKGKITFYARERNRTLFSQLSGTIAYLASKIVERMTVVYKNDKLDIKFYKPGIQRIQALENMKGEISTIEGLSEEDREVFLNALIEEKSRVNAE